MLLHCAAEDLYRAYWRKEILTEVERNLQKQLDLGLIKKGLTGTSQAQGGAAAVQQIVVRMRAYLPEAITSGRTYEHAKTLATNHPKDRHVLAATIAAGARVIVTDNLRDFSPDALAPFGIKALSADAFLADLVELDPQLLLSIVTARAAAHRRPPETLDAMLDNLGRQLPRFSALVRRAYYAGLDDPAAAHITR